MTINAPSRNESFTLRGYDGAIDSANSSGVPGGGSAAFGWTAPNGLATGNSVVISTDGTHDFGVAPAAWLFDTVDNQSGYSGTADGQPVPVGSGKPYLSRKNATEMILSSSNPRRVGGRHYRAYDAGSAYTDAWLGRPDALETYSSNVGSLELFGRFWVYPSETLPSADAIKWFRIWDELNGYGTRISWDIPYLTYPTGYVPDYLSSGYRPVAATWSVVEIHVKFTTRDTADGLITVWVNGAQKKQVTTATCLSIDTNTNAITRGLSFYVAIGYDAGSTPTPAKPVIDFADAWFCATPQRVVISSSPTWAGRGSEQEVQNIVSWTNTTVTATLFAGQFAALTGNYLYLIGENGSPISESGMAL